MLVRIFQTFYIQTEDEFFKVTNYLTIHKKILSSKRKLYFILQIFFLELDEKHRSILSIENLKACIFTTTLIVELSSG